MEKLVSSLLKKMDKDYKFLVFPLHLMYQNLEKFNVYQNYCSVLGPRKPTNREAENLLTMEDIEKLLEDFRAVQLDSDAVAAEIFERIQDTYTESSRYIAQLVSLMEN